MKTNFFAGAFAALALALPATAQFSTVIPIGADTVEGASSSSYPWNLQNSECRIQYVWDMASFPVQTPIVITKMNFRANGSTTATWAGGTYSNMTISLATCTTDYSTATRNFAGNLGSDLTQVFQGSVTVKPSPVSGSTSPQSEFYVEVTLSTPFVFDPAAGDLIADFVNPPSSWTGASTFVDLARYDGTRIYTFGAHGPTAVTLQPNLALVTELEYSNATGLFPAFTATPTSGPANTLVTFTDSSFSSDPAGILAWAWDFGDGSPVSNLQNPTHTYGCGIFSPKLTVTDASGSKTVTKTDLLSFGAITADFNPDATKGTAPFTVNFTDASTAGTLAWSYDFGDGSPAVTTQNPSHTYTAAGSYTVTMTATGPCNTDTVVKTDLIFVRPTGVNCLDTIAVGGNGLTAANCGTLMDLNVKNPAGIKIISLDINSRAAAGTAVSIDVYITADTYVGKHAMAAEWTLVSTGTANSGGAGATELTTIDVDDFLLDAGKYGMYVVYKNGGVHYTNGTGCPGNQCFTNADLDIDLGVSMGSLFTGNPFNPRVFNGNICYADDTSASHGAFGRGCPGSNGLVPQIDFSADPVVNTAFTIDFSDMVAANTACVLLIGLPQPPVDLVIIGMPDCDLNVNSLLTLPFTNNSGTASLPAGIPNDPTLVGAKIHMQAGCGDPTANAFGVTATPGHVARVGL